MAVAGNVDFVGYTTGVPGGVPPTSVGLFGFFDGTGIPVGIGGGAAPRAPSRSHKNEKQRWADRRFARWFDPSLARLIELDRRARVEKKEEFSRLMKEAVARLETVGRIAPVIKQKLDAVLLPYREGPLGALEVADRVSIVLTDEPPPIDYAAMAESDETIVKVDELLEQAEEEEVVAILLAADRLL